MRVLDVHFASKQYFFQKRFALKSKKIFKNFCISHSKTFCRKITSENLFSCSGVLYGMSYILQNPYFLSKFYIL